MSRIDELLREHCPEGVHFPALWEVTTWDKKFNAVERYKQPEVAKYEYLLASDMRQLITTGGDVKLLTTNTADLWTTEELAGDATSEAEVVCIPWGGNPNVQYFKGRFVTADNRIAVVNDPNQLDAKYLYYALQNRLDEIGSFYRGSGIAHPSMSKMLDFQIPLPPLCIQQEIVSILDRFVQLEAELEAELEARRRQYAHYVDLCFTREEGNANFRPLGEIGSFRRGKRITKSELIDHGLGAIHYGEMYTHYGTCAYTTKSFVTPEKRAALSLANSGDLVIAGTGENVQDLGRAVAWLGQEPVAVHDDCFILSHSLEPAFVSYFFQSASFQQQKRRFVAGTKVSRISARDLARIEIPVPSAVEQRRVVHVLATLEKLTSDISFGLPAEVVARRQQYEYYRDRLFDFSRLAA